METFLRTQITWDPETVATHLALFGASAWLAAGGLWRMGRAPQGPPPSPAGPSRTLGAIELGIPLGALTVLLAVFIGLQTRYLFGGEDFVRLTGITYAQFARRGFFELVALCALALPVLLAAQHVVDRRARTSQESFRAFAAAIGALLALVMLSALARMRLYVTMYGLTEDRFYATAFMLWLGTVLAWLVITEWRDRRERFATGAVGAGFVLLACLNVANPDAVIVRINLRRAAAGAELDAAYLSRLSADAVPVLRAAWRTLGAQARCELEPALRRVADRADGWRGWTWSGWRAARVARALALTGDCGSE
jgi:hypothetical protein